MMNLTCRNNSWANGSISLSTQLNQSHISANFSVCMEDSAQSSAPPVNLFGDFPKAAFGSAIFIFVVSPITVLANSLLLITFLVDPLKIFRNPTTYFLIGLATVDLLTGLVQEPIYATCFMFLYFQHPWTQKCRPFMAFATYFAAFSMTISSAIVFAFTLTQYIVVSSPLKYGRMVTKKKVFISLVAIYLYHALFCCLPLMGVPQKITLIIGIFLHNYAVGIAATIVFYVLLHYAMKRKMTAGSSLQNGSTSTPREEGRHIQVQRNFVRINALLLIVLIVFVVPSVIMMTIRHFMEDLFTAYAIKVQIINLMTDNLVYLKFLLDPFVYAWRMSKYRASLKRTVYRCKDIERESSRSANETKITDVRIQGSELASAELDRSAITLISFKNVPEL